MIEIHSITRALHGRQKRKKNHQSPKSIFLLRNCKKCGRLHVTYGPVRLNSPLNMPEGEESGPGVRPVGRATGEVPRNADGVRAVETGDATATLNYNDATRSRLREKSDPESCLPLGPPSVNGVRIYYYTRARRRFARYKVRSLRA